MSGVDVVVVVVAVLVEGGTGLDDDKLDEVDNEAEDVSMESSEGIMLEVPAGNDALRWAKAGGAMGATREVSTGAERGVILIFFAFSASSFESARI